MSALQQPETNAEHFCRTRRERQEAEARERRNRAERASAREEPPRVRPMADLPVIPVAIKPGRTSPFGAEGSVEYARARLNAAGTLGEAIQLLLDANAKEIAELRDALAKNSATSSTRRTRAPRTPKGSSR